MNNALSKLLHALFLLPLLCCASSFLCLGRKKKEYNERKRNKFFAIFNSEYTSRSCRLEVVRETTRCAAMDFRVGDDYFVPILYGILAIGVFLNLLLIFVTIYRRSGLLVGYVAVLDIGNLALLVPESLDIVRGWSFIADFCSIITGFESFINVSLAYAFIVFGVNAILKHFNRNQVEFMEFEEDADEDEHDYEVTDDFLGPSERKSSKCNLWPFVFLIILAGSISVPYFALSTFSQGQCGLKENSVAIKILIVLLKKVVPLLLTVALLICLVVLKTRNQRRQNSNNQNQMVVATVYFITFLFCSSGRLFVDVLTPAKLFFALLHYMASVLRPIFVLACGTNKKRVATHMQ